MKIYRQGDILIKEVDSIPSDAKKKADKVVARGEATSHTHRFENEGVELFLLDNKTYLDLQVPSPLIHDEHFPIELPSGKYEIINEREWDPFEAEIRKVID